MPEAGGTAYINDKPKIIGTAVAGECWHAQGRVFDNHVDLLVDTGASLNVIDTETYTKLSRGRDISMKESNTLLRTANGLAMNFMAFSTARMQGHEQYQIVRSEIQQHE